MLPICKSSLLNLKHNGPKLHYFSPVSIRKVYNTTDESGKSTNMPYIRGTEVMNL